MEPEFIRFILFDGKHIDVDAAVAMTASEVIKAAVQHDSRAKNSVAFETQNDVPGTQNVIFEFSLADWAVDIARFVIEIMKSPTLQARPTFDFWIDAVILASYLMMDTAVFCGLEIWGDINYDKLINTAIKYKIGDLLARLEGWPAEPQKIVDTLAPIATADIIWMVKAGHWSRQLAIFGIVSRTETADTEAILRHMILEKSADELAFISDNCECLDPTSKHLIDFIIKLCEAFATEVRTYLKK